jgi:putative membrane protein
MLAISRLLIGLIAALHAYIAYFEMFAWEATGPRVFSTFPAELFAQTIDLAANQGVYNAFLAAGLIWALTIADRAWQRNIATCFLLFVMVAGLVGAVTVSPRILMIQTIPALIAALLLWRAARQ